jgi:hypothetical protein
MAAARIGEMTKASGYFEALLEVSERSDTDRPRLVEVRRFMNAHSAEAA